MSSTRAVDPSVSATPIPLDAENLATVCVLCSHNCGLRVDVADGRHQRGPRRRVEPDHPGLRLQQGLLDRPLRRPRAARRASAASAAPTAPSSASPGSRRSPRSPRGCRHPRPALAARDRAGRHRRPGESHGRALRPHLAVGARLEALVQRLRAGEDAALPGRPVDVRFAALRLLPSRHRAQPTSCSLHGDATRRSPTAATTPPTPSRASPPTRTQTAGRARPARDRDDAQRRPPRARQARDPTPTSCSAWPPSIVAERRAGRRALPRSERTHGFDDAAQGASSAVDIDEMARRAGVPTAELIEVARAYASCRDRRAIMFDLAVEQNLFSTLISYLIQVLSALTGNVGQARRQRLRRDASTPPRAQPEAPRRAGARARLRHPGDQRPRRLRDVLADPGARGDPARPPRAPARADRRGRPTRCSPTPTRSAGCEAREQLDLLVVIEPAMTETARIADYVLPTPVGYEKWEIAGFPKGYPEIYTQLRPPVVPGPPEALPEPEIYARLAEAMQPRSADPPAQLFDLADARPRARRCGGLPRRAR